MNLKFKRQEVIATKRDVDGTILEIRKIVIENGKQIEEEIITCPKQEQS